MDGMPSEEELLRLALSDASDPKVQMRLLSYRVAVLTKEKEKLEDRLAKLEKAYVMGTGIFWALPVVGVIVGYFTANWGWLTKPWMTRVP